MSSAESLQSLANGSVSERTIDDDNDKSGREDCPHNQGVESGVSLHVVDGIEVDAVEFVACAWPGREVVSAMFPQ